MRKRGCVREVERRGEVVTTPDDVACANVDPPNLAGVRILGQVTDEPSGRAAEIKYTVPLLDCEPRVVQHGDHVVKVLAARVQVVVESWSVAFPQLGRR